MRPSAFWPAARKRTLLTRYVWTSGTWGRSARVAGGAPPRVSSLEKGVDQTVVLGAVDSSPPGN